MKYTNYKIGDYVIWKSKNNCEYIKIEEKDSYGWIWSEDFKTPYISRTTSEHNYHNSNFIKRHMTSQEIEVYLSKKQGSYEIY